MIRNWVLAAGIVGLLLSAGVDAAPCAGFTDVDSASTFCPNVEWLKNRNVTIGCSSTTLYCPTDTVSRLSMAAFLNRLGNALEPVFKYTSQSAVMTTVAVGGVVCVTTPYLVTGFPRVATATAMFYHAAHLSVEVGTGMVYSLNGGGAWLSFSDFFTDAENVAESYITQSPVAKPIILQVNDSVTFGIRTDNAVVYDAGCSITVRLDSHSGPSSPFDP